MLFIRFWGCCFLSLFCLSSFGISNKVAFNMTIRVDLQRSVVVVFVHFRDWRAFFFLILLFGLFCYGLSLLRFYTPGLGNFFLDRSILFDFLVSKRIL